MPHIAKLPHTLPVPAGAGCVIASDAPVISTADLKIHCQSCSVRELCLPFGLTINEMNQVDALVAHRTKVRKHGTLYRAGDSFRALYAIRMGSLKTTMLNEDGDEQVTGYHILGEIIGFDGIGTGSHGADAIALEDSEVCALPFRGIESLARAVPALQHNIHQLMSKEIARDHGMMLLLGGMKAEERLASFLLNLSDRYLRRGYSPTDYVLRMSRHEIGSYLGLKLETVSRLFSRFHGEGLIQIQGRSLKVLDLFALKKIIHRPAGPVATPG